MNQYRQQFVRALTFVAIGYMMAARLKAQDDAAPRPPQIPLTAVELALADVQTVPLELRPYTKYIWLRTGAAEYPLAAFVCDTALCRHSGEVRPALVAGGALVRVNLLDYAENEVQLKALLSAWHEMAYIGEPQFHEPVIRIPAKPYVGADGKTYDYHWGASKPALHLGQSGDALEDLLGRVHPGQSVCPIVALPWFTKASLSSIDGNLYLKFRGLKVGRTTLSEYLASRGASFDSALKSDGVDRAIVAYSQVTGKERGINLYNGQGEQPTRGQPIVAITDDNFDDNRDNRANPLRSLLDHKADGHEVFVKRGPLEMTLWDGNQKLVAEAPPNLVADHKGPDPHHKRLYMVLSCIRCHKDHMMWQPFPNDLNTILSDRGRLAGDFSKGFSLDSQFDAVRRIQHLYHADQEDIDRLLFSLRSSFEVRVQKVCGLEAKQVLDGVVALHDAYEYQPVTAAVACDELGIKPRAGVTPVDALRLVLLPPNPEAVIPDDPHISALLSERFDPIQQLRVGVSIPRREWERVYSNAMLRALPAVQEALEPENSNESAE